MEKLLKTGYLVLGISRFTTTPKRMVTNISYKENTTVTITKVAIEGLENTESDTNRIPSTYIEASQPYQEALQAAIENTKTPSIYFPTVLQENCR
ncbi:MAG: hypothetical protein ACJARX_000920 [Psychroserpens sp.]|uniref:hypothetical protein n=1 Tax=Psychroserpens sp. TaxID=2020870 RepID=UPI0039E28B27